MSRPESHTVKLLGYSRSSAEDILGSALANGPATLHPGDYTAWSEDEQGVIARIVSAPVAAFPTYFTFSASGLPVFGSDVFTVAREAGLSWDWNIQAIRSLALFGHTVGTDTLHPAVWRVPNDTSIDFAHAPTEQRTLAFWDATPPRTNISNALQETRRAFRRDTSDGKVLLSLSAGYDSRLLLAICLAEGIRPRCVTMGAPDTTDVQIATELARVFELEHRRIDLRPRDYLAHGQEISRLTSGTKTAGNWHTYLYSREAGAIDAEEIHLVGTNGEFARSFYLENPPAVGGKRFIHQVAKTAPILASHLPSRTAQAYWFARFVKRAQGFRDFTLVSKSGLTAMLRLAGMTGNRRSDMASSLDEFYATQRIRHFGGNGLALYSANGRPRSPFLDAAVVRAIWGLPRESKVENRFHVESIRRLNPSLLTLPFNSPLTGPHRSFSEFAGVRALPAAREIIMDSSNLDSLIPRGQRETLVESGTAGTYELLLTLAFAANNT